MNDKNNRVHSVFIEKVEYSVCCYEIICMS
jgi:hypothetical protein